MESHLEEFNVQGYTILKGFLNNDEIDEIINELAKIYSLSLGEDITQKSSAVGYSYENLCSIYDECANSNAQLKARSYDISKSLASVSRTTAKCADSLRQNFTERTFIITGQQVRCDDRFGNGQLELHQDIMGMKSDSGITCWIPLLDTNEIQGGLKIVPDSHSKGPIQHEWLESRSGIKAHVVCDYKLHESSTVILSVGAGDALFFHPCLLHGTAENRSSQSRWTFICRFDDIGDLRYLTDETKENCISEANEAYVL